MPHSQEAEVGGHLSLGVQGQPGQHSKMVSWGEKVEGGKEKCVLVYSNWKQNVLFEKQVLLNAGLHTW